MTLYCFEIREPVIAAISRHTVAGSLKLSLLADMRVVEEDAVFEVFCQRWGLPLIDGETVRLPAIIGLESAMDIMMTGRAVGAKGAYEIRFAIQVVPRGEGFEEARKIPEQLLEFPRMGTQS